MSLSRQHVTSDRELILLKPRNAKLGRQSIARNPHHLPRGVVRNRGRLQRYVLHFQPFRQVSECPKRPSLFHGFGHGDQLLPNGTRQADRNVAKRLNAAGDDTRCLSAQDLLDGARDGDTGGDACLFDIRIFFLFVSTKLNAKT